MNDYEKLALLNAKRLISDLMDTRIPEGSIHDADAHGVLGMINTAIENAKENSVCKACHGTGYRSGGHNIFGLWPCEFCSK